MPAIEKGRVRRILSHGFSALVAVSGPNFFYLTGKNIKSYERPLMLIATWDDCLIVAPKLEEERISDLSCGGKIIYEDGEDPFHMLQAEVRALGVKGREKIALDPEMKLDLFFKLSHALPDFNLASGRDAFLQERMKKDDYELENIRRAATILDELFKKAEELISEKKTEAEIMVFLSLLAHQLGGDAAESLSVQSGPNTAIPHHEYSNRQLTRGDLVLLDLVVSYEGYKADLTRVYSLGKPNYEVEKVYDSVREALERGFSELHIDMKAGELDSIVRGELAKRGLDKYFTHRTGHGIGVEVHELPNIAPRSPDVIQERSVFTIEPGVYLPGKFGIRLEIDVATFKNGSEILGSYPLELRTI